MTDFLYYDEDNQRSREIKVPIPSMNDIMSDNSNGIMGGAEFDFDEPNVEEAKKAKPSKSKSFAFDPYYATAFLQNIRKPSPFSAEILRTMAKSCKPVAAVIITRQNQVSNFLTPAKTRQEMGYKITTKDKDKKVTRSVKKRIKEIEYFLQHTGFPERTADGMKRVGFESFVRQLVKDRLTLDSTCFERTFDRMGRLAEVIPVDGGTIRKVINKNNYMSQVQEWVNMRDSETRTRNVAEIEDVEYVQVIKGNIVAEFTDKELVYGICNPSTDVNRLGYGESELELLIETVTSQLFAEQYNRANFTQGAIPRGVISIVGNYDQEMLEAFKRQWTMQVAGVANAFKLPVIALTDGDGFKFTPFDMSSREMEYHLWITYLVALVCAIYQIDPEEIGFQGYRPQPGGSLFQQSGEYKMEQSKDRGLKPLMRFIQRLINVEIIDLIYDDLMLEWVNFDEKSELEKLEAYEKQLNLGLKTVNEIRAELDEPEIDEEWANAPANPTLLQIYMKGKEMEDQAQNQFMEHMLGGSTDTNEDQQPGPPQANNKKKKPIKKSQTDNVVLEFIA